MPRDEKIQLYFLGSLLQSDDIHSLIQSLPVTLLKNDFITPSHGMVFEELVRFATSQSAFSINEFAKKLPPELRSVADDLSMQTSIQTEKSEVPLMQLALEIKADSLKKHIKHLLEDAQNSHDEDISRLQTELKEVEKKHSSL
jgi:replicative DNA helicase